MRTPARSLAESLYVRRRESSNNLLRPSRIGEAIWSQSETCIYIKPGDAKKCQWKA
jgi:hypothetical protein